MAIKNQKIVADFETTTTKDDVRVWAVCAVDIPTAETVFMSNNLGEFMAWLSNKNTVCYFHNLKFDGEFILYWLLKNGYEYSTEHTAKTFETLITDDGIFYSITVYFERQNKKYKKVTFYDSLKKLPFKVATISKAFELEDEKLRIDYDAPRPVGHQLTEEEKRYIVNDCRIVAQALKIQMEKGLTKMTNASDALNGYKQIAGKKYFEKWFPVFPVELDADIRQAYKGGFVYLNPKYRGVRGLQGVTFDVNSLYPSVMYEKILPYGYPVFFEGEPEPDENYPLFIVRLSCTFELKPGHIPTIQLKNNRAYVETEYLTTSKTADGCNLPVEMTLTSVDLALFLEHYEQPGGITYICGWKFKGKSGLFTEYIDYWMHIKETTTGAMRQLAKLMLNSLYGKFATNPKARKKIPDLDWVHDVVHYRLDEPELREPVYTAMGAFITAYAREKTIRSAQAVFPRFIYADTDSLHIIGHDVPEDLDVHPTRLGAWKNEGEFIDSKYLRAKTYMETTREHKEDSLEAYCKLLNKSFEVWREDEGIRYHVTKVTCAGMPDNVKYGFEEHGVVYEGVNYDTFEPGNTFEGKLVPRRYPGGIVLEKSTFTIK